MRVETDDGVELWVEQTGEGPGLPLVLCHGGPGLWDYLGPLATFLDQQRSVVRWDQRGCGRSEGADGPFTTEQYVHDLETIRRALGFSRWIVGGHSWGASLALRAVLTHPRTAAGLLYMSGIGFGWEWHAAYKAAPTERLTKANLARLAELGGVASRTRAEEVEWRTLAWAPDFADRLRAIELAALDAAAPWPINWDCNASIGAELRTWDEATMLDDCSNIATPTLILHGAQDPRPPSAIERLAQTIHHAELHVVDEVGHTPWLERPGVVVPLLRAWLERLDLLTAHDT